jgi:hypothetical protein
MRLWVEFVKLRHFGAECALAGRPGRCGAEMTTSLGWQWPPPEGRQSRTLGQTNRDSISLFVAADGGGSGVDVATLASLVLPRRMRNG